MSNTLIERLSKRIAMQPLHEIKDCCVAEIVKGFPTMSGASKTCRYCGEVLKAVSASDFGQSDCIGALSETRRVYHAEDLADDGSVLPRGNVVIGKVWFAKDKGWSDVDQAIAWCKDRDIKVTKAIEHDRAFELIGARMADSTSRAVCPDSGVIVEVGLPFERQITTSALMGGGLLNPAQGNSGPKKRLSGHNVGRIVTTLPSGPGMQVSETTDQADGDGHSHQINASITTDAGGPMLICRTSVEKEHQHVVRIPYRDGAVVGTTEPSAAITGGHSHKHGFRWICPEMKEAGVGEDLRDISPQDVANLRRAASMISVVISEKSISKVSGIPNGKPGKIALSRQELDAITRLVKVIQELADRCDSELKKPGA